MLAVVRLKRRSPNLLWSKFQRGKVGCPLLCKLHSNRTTFRLWNLLSLCLSVKDGKASAGLNRCLRRSTRLSGSCSEALILMELAGTNVTDMALTFGKVGLAISKRCARSKAKKKAKQGRPCEVPPAGFPEGTQLNTVSPAATSENRRALVGARSVAGCLVKADPLDQSAN